ncbi:MAG TPA: 5,6-dimethylbenzimidazole synthase [Acidimicrobiales bacterium]|nr:5,6-dimethylbenzimidazole synthase [Acidimicrobiales bacterium]
MGPGEEQGEAAGPAGRGSGALAGFYDVVHRRRDVRAEFSGEPVDEVVLARVLGAAHSAPSVGLSQPWDFVLVSEPGLRRAFWEHVQQERSTFAASLEGERAERFAGIKIDGILEASLSVVVTYDPARGAPGVLGRHAIADAGLYSVCLAIENMWLACTAEGWGMGWVSFYRESFLRRLLGIPESIRPVAWLCVGPVSALQDTPDLERHGWRARASLGAALHLDRWDGTELGEGALAAAARGAAVPGAVQGRGPAPATTSPGGAP